MSSGGESGTQKALDSLSKVSSPLLSLSLLLFISFSPQASPDLSPSFYILPPPPPPDPNSGSDFKLDSFNSPCETFDPHYGVGGYEGDGDITNPANQSEFRDYVMENTEGQGVHFVMADGVSKTTLEL